ATVRRMTDRYAGIGADGVIRVVPTDAVPDYAHLADAAEWFMDYRNADGSVAEMCGNGVRAMARYLWESGYAEGPVLHLATRGGGAGVPSGDAQTAVAYRRGAHLAGRRGVGGQPARCGLGRRSGRARTADRAGGDQPEDAVPGLGDGRVHRQPWRTAHRDGGV